MHNIFPCGIYLKKIGIKISDICTHCNNNVSESIEHYLLQCPELDNFWKQVQRHILIDHNSHVSITENDKIMGSPNIEINRIIMLAKYAIYICKTKDITCYQFELERQLSYFNAIQA